MLRLRVLGTVASALAACTRVLYRIQSMSSDDPLDPNADPFRLPHMNCRCVILRVLDTVHLRRSAVVGEDVALYRADVVLARGAGAIVRWLVAHREYTSTGKDEFSVFVGADDPLTTVIASMQYPTLAGVLSLHNSVVAKKLFSLKRINRDGSAN